MTLQFVYLFDFPRHPVFYQPSALYPDSLRTHYQQFQMLLVLLTHIPETRRYSTPTWTQLGIHQQQLHCFESGNTWQSHKSRQFEPLKVRPGAEPNMKNESD